MDGKLIGIGEAARMLGCSPSNIRKMERLGRLHPAMRVAGRRIFRVADIDQFAEQRRAKAA